MELKKINRIKFNKKYENPILDGKKTSTIRTNCDLNPGDIFYVIIDENGLYLETFDTKPAIGKPDRLLCKAQVEEVQRIRFDEINNTLAFTEGMRHQDLVKYDLLSYYPNLTDSSLLYYVVFKIIRGSVK